MDSTKLFIEKKVWVILLKFSLPAIIGTLITRFIILLTEFLSETAPFTRYCRYNNRISNYDAGVCVCCTGGLRATTLVSINLGQKKTDEAERL
jgi:Na+-driven multidrug efflux pump